MLRMEATNRMKRRKKMGEKAKENYKVRALKAEERKRISKQEWDEENARPNKN